MSNRQRKRSGESRRAPLADAPEPEPIAPWKIRFAKSVRDTDRHELSTSALDIARKAIDKKLKVDPQQYGEYLHRPLQGFYKLKTSAVRIVYHVDPEAREVWILAMGDRRDIWKDQDDILRRWDQARDEFRPDDMPLKAAHGKRNR